MLCFGPVRRIVEELLTHGIVIDILRKAQYWPSCSLRDRSAATDCTTNWPASVAGGCALNASAGNESMSSPGPDRSAADVIEDRPAVSGASWTWRRQVRPSSASMVAASDQANCSPMHILGPAPKGRYAPRG